MKKKPRQWQRSRKGMSIVFVPRLLDWPRKVQKRRVKFYGDRKRWRLRRNLRTTMMWRGRGWR